MNRYLPMLMSVLVLLMAVGCETLNPLCNSDWCVEGRVYPRSELDVAVFDEVNVSTGDVLGVLGNATPQTHKDDILAHIVADVESGGTAYLDQSITTTVTIRTDNAEFERKGYVTIIVPSHTTSFYIVDTATPANMDRFKKGWLYMLRLNIYRITYSAEYDDYRIFSTLDKTLSITESPPTPIFADLDDIITDVAGGGLKWFGKTVTFDAVVSDVFPDGGGVTLSTSLDAESDTLFFYFDDALDTTNTKRGDRGTYTTFIYVLSDPRGRGEYSIFSQPIAWE